MPKRKEVCVRCGVGSQEIHSMCYNCHEQDLDGYAEKIIARTGNDYFTRCDEKDCWVCDTFKWEHKLTRPPKFTKKELINRARGRNGKRSKQDAIEELERRKSAEDQANFERLPQDPE